jgi:hypothetical protein
VTVARFRRKPRAGDDDVQYAAQYLPGADLGALAEVAAMASGKAELREVRFGVGTVLLVRYVRFDDDHPARIDYETVEPGDWLAWSGEGFLYDASDGNWAQFYDRLEE